MRAGVAGTRSSKVAIAIAAVVAMFAALLVGLASPASADASVTISVGSRGTTGVPQDVSASVSSDVVGAPSGNVIFTANGQAIGTQPVGGSLGSTARISWTPSNAGAITVQAEFDPSDGASAFDSRVSQIGLVNTASSISTPGTAAASSVIPLTATVRASTGSYVPTGGVTFYLNNGSAIGSTSLDGSGRGSVNYTTPATVGTIYVYAVYGGDSNANSSKTATDSIKISATASSVTLVVPQTNYVNTSVQLTAKITPTNASGSVDFSINGKYLNTAKVANGAAAVTWVPSSLGTFTVAAKYSGGNGVNGGNASNSVQVIQQLKGDVITINPAGSAGAWAPGSSTSLYNGSSVTLGTSSASGSPVVLSISGPCSLTGNVVKVNGVGGPCTLTASTNGGNGYAPTSQQYIVQTVAGPQTANVSAPKSGSYAKGKKLKLSSTGTVTNVNQPVKWKVTKGGSYCKVIKTGGYYKLSLVKKGSCAVKGSAPAISNQWSAYSTTRNYTVK